MYELTVFTVGAVKPCYTRAAVRVHFTSTASFVLTRIRRAFIYVCGIEKIIKSLNKTVIANEEYQSIH